MQVLGPFPELDDHEYKVITLENGITALLISSQKKDTVARRATSKMDLEERRAIARLLRDASNSSLVKDPPKQRRSTLITDNGGSLRNLFRTSQRGLGGSRRSETGFGNAGEDQAGITYKGRTSEKFGEDSGEAKPLRTSQRIAEDTLSALENKRTSRRLANGNDDDVEDRVSVRSMTSHKSLPGNTSYRRNKSQRMSSTVSLALQPSNAHSHQMQTDDSLPSITDLAAVAVCVSVGSLSDPEDCQGLAHVVEHMVFMGNEMHPSENDWDTFISGAGGDSNATTEAERTTFHFSVPQESFDDSVARFAQFFHRPLLRQESLQRELAAIDSEFNDSAGEVSFRLAEIACATARKGPFSQFACGNSKTLKSNPHLHDYVLEFFRTHYVARNLNVVLYSSDSLSDLEEICRQHFQTIPAVREPQRKGKLHHLKKFVPSHPPFRTVTISQSSNEERANKTDDRSSNEEQNSRQQQHSHILPGLDGYSLGCIIVCDPEGNQPHTLQLSWQLPNQRPNWRTKPLSYLAHALGSETDGSILSELKSKGWANALFASDGTYASGIEGNSVSTLFSIYILMTDIGLLNWEAIVSAVYEYLGMLAREGIQAWFFEELRKCQHASFVFRETSDPGTMVETLCQRLCVTVSEIPPERVCNGEDLLFDWDPSGVRDILKLLVPETCRIDLVTRASELSISTTYDTAATLSSASTAASSSASTSTVHSAPPSNSGTNGETSANRFDVSQDDEQQEQQQQQEPTLPSIADKWLRKRIKRRVFDVLLKGCDVRTEPWYQTKYCVLQCPKKLISKWRNAMKMPKTFAHLPKPNEYISDDFDLKPKMNPKHLPEDADQVYEYGSRLAKVEARCDPDLVLLSLQDTSITGRAGERIWTREKWVKSSPLSATSPQFRAALSGSSMSTLLGEEARATSGDVEHEEWLYASGSLSSPANGNAPSLLELENGPHYVNGRESHSSSNPQQPSRQLGGHPREQHRLHLWYLQNGSFQSCRVNLTLLFKFSLASCASSPLNSALIDLLLICFEDAIADEKYPSALSGTFLETLPDERGIKMVFSGFSNTVRLLVERTLPVLLDCATHGIKHLKNLALDSQVQVVTAKLANDDCSVKETLNGVLRVDDHHPLSKLSALEQVQNIRSKLDSFVKATLSKCIILGFLYGNASMNEAVEMRTKLGSLMSSSLQSTTTLTNSSAADLLLSSSFAIKDTVSTVSASIALSSSSNGRKQFPEKTEEIFLLQNYFVPKRTLNIPPSSKQSRRESATLMGTTSVFIAPVPSSSVLVYYQVLFENLGNGRSSTSAPQDDVSKRDLRVLSQLLAQLLKEPLFNTLRTNWQIAYHAHASFHRCEASSGIAIEVSSHHTGTVDLVEIIDEFLLLFLETVLKPMPPVEFNRHVRALELRKLEKDTGPIGEAKRHFATIIRGAETGRFDWNLEASETQRMRFITKTGLIDFFNRFVHPSSPERRKLSLLIVGESEMALSQITKSKKSMTQRGAKHRSIGYQLSSTASDMVEEEGEDDEIILLEETVEQRAAGSASKAATRTASSLPLDELTPSETSTTKPSKKTWWSSSFLRKITSSST